MDVGLIIAMVMVFVNEFVAAFLFESKSIPKQVLHMVRHMPRQSLLTRDTIAYWRKKKKKVRACTVSVRGVLSGEIERKGGTDG